MDVPPYLCHRTKCVRETPHLNILQIFVPRDGTVQISNFQHFYDISFTLYLISRPGYNSWLINAEKKWMEEYNIKYDSPVLDCSHKSNVKGFVYRIMNSMFSNTSQKAFRKKLLCCYQEFITVRNRKKFDESNKFLFPPYIFKSTYKGYIVTPRQEKKSSKTMQDILCAGKSWIKDCQGFQMDVTQIHNLVNQLYNKKLVVRSRDNSGILLETDDQQTDLMEEEAENILNISGGKNVVKYFDVSWF